MFGLTLFNGTQLAKMKGEFLTCPCHKIDRVEAVSLSVSNYTLKITNFVNTACVDKSASLKEHFFLEKLYVNLEKVYNNMIGNIISFYRKFVLGNLDVWFINYGKSCEVPPNLFGLIH